jgi:hypothetical protein
VKDGSLDPKKALGIFPSGPERGKAVVMLLKKHIVAYSEHI